jgi:hypothetical protein
MTMLILMIVMDRDVFAVGSDYAGLLSARQSRMGRPPAEASHILNMTNLFCERSEDFARC